MTIEEYDRKVEIRKKIDKIDKILEQYKLREQDHKKSSEMFLGVGCSSWILGEFSYYVGDEILEDRFKELLLQRKQELITEFVNEYAIDFDTKLEDSL